MSVGYNFQNYSDTVNSFVDQIGLFYFLGCLFTSILPISETSRTTSALLGKYQECGNSKSFPTECWLP
jgi:hypothetical protein